jgi:hypothetical protein
VKLKFLEQIEEKELDLNFNGGFESDTSIIFR